jgi:hypothetical protein
VTRLSDSELIDREIAVATRFVNQSRRFDRSAREHLEQHQRWLEHYAAQETKDREWHERRLGRQQVRHQRIVRRQRMLQRCRQLALAVALFVHSSALSMLNRVVSALIHLTELLLVSASWIGAKIYALGRLFIKVLAVSFSWLQIKARDFARSTAKLLAIGLSWSRVKARAFALALTTAASVSFSWLQIKARDFARSTAKLLAIGLSWSRVKARAFALALTTAASVSLSLAKARNPASSLRGLVTASRLQARKYRRRCLALAVGVAEAARKGIQGLHRSTEPIKRALTQSHHGSSIFNSGADNGSTIPKREDDIEPEPQHATFRHQEVPAAPVSRMDVPTSGNQSPVKTRSRKRSRHRKRKRRHASHGLSAVHTAG